MDFVCTENPNFLGEFSILVLTSEADAHRVEFSRIIRESDYFVAGSAQFPLGADDLFGQNEPDNADIRLCRSDQQHALHARNRRGVWVRNWED